MKDSSLILKYRKLDADIARFADWLASGDGGEYFVPLEQNRAAAEGRLADLRRKNDQIAAPDAVFSLLKAHFSDYLDALAASLRSRFTRPARSLNGAMWGYEFMSRKDSRAPHVRARKILEGFKRSGDILSAIEGQIGGISPVYLHEALGACKSNAEHFARHAREVDAVFPQLDAQTAKALKSGLEGFAQRSAKLAESIGAALQSANLPGETTDDSVLRLDGYAELLMNEHGVDLQELLAWHESEIEKTRTAVFDIARALNIPEKNAKTMGEVNAILLKYAGPAENGEQTLARGREYIKRTKAACRDYVKLPDDETCLVTPVPEIIKYSYPWGGYGGGCPRRRPLVGEMFLNDFNYKAVTDGWIKMNTIHEAYPGHHVQFIRTTLDPIPETLKRGAKSTPITEGTPHRSEKLFEFVFEEDPFFPLFVAYRRHHTAVRIKADLMLRHFGNTIGEVVQLYMDEMDFDRGTARGQVKAQENMAGYFTTYYYGYKMLSQWESEYTFDQKQYTELLFSAGRMSLNNFKRFLDLSDEQRASLTHDFASLIQFNEDYSEKPIELE